MNLLSLNANCILALYAESHKHESEAPEEYVACQDHLSYSTSEEDNEEFAWEDRPYY